MTREEAKEILTHNWTRVDNPNYSESELDEAFFMAIEALSAGTIKFDFNKYRPSVRNKVNDGTPSADVDGEDLIIKGAKGIKDGLYNIQDGKLFKYKANGGTVRTYTIVPSAEADWIPIKTLEPNTADHVLVTYKWSNGDLEVSELDYWIAKIEAEDGNAWCKRLIDHVIAWRPMLKPYREDGE